MSTRFSFRSCCLVGCLLLLSLVKAQTASAQTVSIPKDTAELNTSNFAREIVSVQGSNFEKSKRLLDWLSSHFSWTYTDYKSRTVKEIIVRQGGNCFELASVYMELVGELNIKYRMIAEVNIQPESKRREADSEQKIKELGNKASIFGGRHNDHRWVEVYDDQSGKWIPTDPTMDLIGVNQWLKARAWFGKRHTINDAFSKDMLFPIGIFVVDRTDNSKIAEDRTEYYMINSLNQLYDNKLSKLKSWPVWVDQLTKINNHVRAAFQGKENLHLYSKEINDVAKTYDELKSEYLASTGDHP
jgi:hypothetical protein